MAVVNRAWLLERGWTRTAIQRILGEPDLKEVHKDRIEYLYDIARVLQAEESGPIRYRKSRTDYLPGPTAPADLTRTMLDAGSPTARRRVLRNWAEERGLMPSEGSARTKSQWRRVVDQYTATT
jgi:hypothetical protein